jgi:solute carrier family 25 (mitochondrial carnitine/acylcarnitine transporter), member 20/29
MAYDLHLLSVAFSLTCARLMGSLTLYRRLLLENVFNRDARPGVKLPPVGHGIAGIFAGWTVSVIAAPGQLTSTSPMVPNSY